MPKLDYVMWYKKNEETKTIKSNFIYGNKIKKNIFIHSSEFNIVTEFNMVTHFYRKNFKILEQIPEKETIQKNMRIIDTLKMIKLGK